MDALLHQRGSPLWGWAEILALAAVGSGWTRDDLADLVPDELWAIVEPLLRAAPGPRTAAGPG
jgi:hypothetical protein